MATDFGAMRRINSSSCGLNIKTSPRRGVVAEDFALYPTANWIDNRLRMVTETLPLTETREIISYDPSTGEEIGRAPLMNPAEVAAAVAKAKAAQPAWAALTYRQRARVVLRAREIVL